MSHHPLVGLDAELSRILGEPKLTIRVDASKAGGPDDHVIGVINPRERILRMNLANPPARHGKTWNQRQARSWREGWRQVLTTIGVCVPVVDAHAMASLVCSRQHLCVIADTSAVMTGVVSWLANAMWNCHVELVMTSVVERELFGLSDQTGFWTKEDPVTWKVRVGYRLARALSETPLPNVDVVRPMSDEKAAVMLAKRRTPGQKSPDADVLLIEQAREVLYTGPPRVRTLYVTCDRNHARSAVAVLPPGHVLFADQADVYDSIIGMAAFWQPGGPLGALRPVRLAEIVWAFLAATNRVVLEGKGLVAEIRSVQHGLGRPSDWMDPWVAVEWVTHEATSTTAADGTNQAAAPSERIRPPAALQQAGYLLPPIPVGPPIMPAALRPTPSIMRTYLNRALHSERLEPPGRANELERESFRLLVQLGALTESGDAVSGSELLDAVRSDAWDRVHAHFRRSPGYDQALSGLRDAPGAQLGGRARTQVLFARRLGQVAQVSSSHPLMAGDAPLTEANLVSFLERVMPSVGTDYPVNYVCAAALDELRVTPARFERALQLMFDAAYDGVSLETGGSVGHGAAETVFRTVGGNITEVRVSVSALYFGGERPIKSLRRRV